MQTQAQAELALLHLPLSSFTIRSPIKAPTYPEETQNRKPRKAVPPPESLSTIYTPRRRSINKMLEMLMMSNLGSILATLFFIQTLCRQYIPPEVYAFLHRFLSRLFRFLNPYACIVIEDSDGFRESELFDRVEQYLSHRNTYNARRLLLKKPKNSKSYSLCVDKNEQIVDEFQGVKLWWVQRRNEKKNSSPWWGSSSEEKRSFELTFRAQHRALVLDFYIGHVVEEAENAERQSRQRRLFTNSGVGGDYSFRSRSWTSIPFEHPSSFESLAFESKLKQEILQDLEKFKNSRRYYAKVGRAWKRGYLLYGPPGTGKSSMIAAMANYLNYDIYDLELTQVRNNSELRKLLVNTTDKSIIVIEDIDCSVDFSDRDNKSHTSKKKKKKQKDGDTTTKKSSETVNNSNNHPKHPTQDDGNRPVDENQQHNKVTLSGVLNFTDGLWSSCGSERIFVFTTNHVDRLDPALLRPGRMDKRIHLSFCGFHAFTILARNYLEIDGHHELFPEIERLIDEAELTPADVAEYLIDGSHDPTSALEAVLDAMRASIHTKKHAQANANAAAESVSDADVDSSSESASTSSSGNGE